MKSHLSLIIALQKLETLNPDNFIIRMLYKNSY